MLKHCLACAREFSKNAELEFLPTGRRVAFDPRRGRLWLVCGWCGHWSLLPIEDRWEAIEELETHARGQAVVLGSTDQVSLLSVGSIEAVRVGRAPAREEAWWRYGKVLRGRRLRYEVITRTGGWFAAAAVTTTVTAAVLMVPDVAIFKWRSIKAVPGKARQAGAEVAKSFERWFRYGRIAWPGTTQCASCGHVLNGLHFRDRASLLVEPDGSVRVPCQRCEGPEGWYLISRDEGENMLRRILAYENLAGATDAELRSAMQLIRAGGLDGSDPLSLDQAERTKLIAVELLLSDRLEARALGLELADVERRWRSEEDVAAIIDRELTPLPKVITPTNGPDT